MWFQDKISNNPTLSNLFAPENRKTLISVIIVVILMIGIVVGTVLNQTVLNLFSRAFSQPGSYGYGSFGANQYQATGAEISTCFSSTTLAYLQGIDANCQVITVQADYNGDGVTDPALYMKNGGKWVVYGVESGWNYGGDTSDWPVPGDFNGDKKTDIAVFRRSNANWYISGRAAAGFGDPNDIPVPADYDGDGKTDVAVYRPSNQHWYISQSTNGYRDEQYGETTTDIPVPADYDGDGKADLAFYKLQANPNYNWLVRPSSGANQMVIQFGYDTDVPVPGDYNGDKKADIAVFRPSTGQWIFGFSNEPVGWGQSGDVPVPGYYQNTTKANIGVFRPATLTWYRSGDGTGLAFSTSNNRWADKPSDPGSLRTGLISYWDMNETDGYWATDLISRNTGSATNATITPGKFGNGRKIGLSGSYIGASGIPYTSDLISIAAWVKPGSTSFGEGNFASIFNKRTSANDSGLTFEFAGYQGMGQGQLQCKMKIAQTGGGIGEAAITTPQNRVLNQGVWNHVACVYDGKNTHIYINGALTASSPDVTGKVAQSPGAEIMMGQNIVSGQGINSEIDEVMVWNRALTGGEVAALNSGALPNPQAVPSPSILPSPSVIPSPLPSPVISPSPVSQPSPSPVTASSSPVRIVGDIDGDGDVDIFDFNTLVRDFKDQNLRSDLNSNNRVDLFDFNQFVGIYIARNR